MMTRKLIQNNNSNLYILNYFYFEPSNSMGIEVSPLLMFVDNGPNFEVGYYYGPFTNNEDNVDLLDIQSEVVLSSIHGAITLSEYINIINNSFNSLEPMFGLEHPFDQNLSEKAIKIINNMIGKIKR